MKKIFVFGGSFDPVHLGHMALIRSILHRGGELRLVPAGPHPEGKNYLFSPGQRLLLLKAALGLLDSQDFSAIPLDEASRQALASVPLLSPHIRICEEELFQKQITYTVHLLEHFLEEDPSLDLHLVVGADQASHMDRWKSFEKLRTLASLWTVPREGHRPQADIPWNFLEFPPTDLSSTEIRRMMQAGERGWERFLPAPAALLARVFLKNPLY